MSRTIAQLRQHYEIEKELARRLRNASRQERPHLYASLYDEMYQNVPLHPQLCQKLSPEKTAEAVSRQMKFLNRFINREDSFLEVGPGDCALSLEVAKYVKRVVAVDISYEITKGLSLPQNLQLILSDGCSIPTKENSISVAYSNQLMEHLHPDDAFEQLQNIYKSLIRGGLYICITPNRLSGPHDISKYFEKVANGFHLKEYTVSELSGLFRKSGFSTLYYYFRIKGIYIKSTPYLICFFEKLLDFLPYILKVKIARNLLPWLFSEIRLIGKK